MLRSSRSFVLFPRWSGSCFDCWHCFGVGVGGVGWHASWTRGSWGSGRGDLETNSVGGRDFLSSSTVGCWGGGRGDSAAVKRERLSSRMGSIGKYA